MEIQNLQIKDIKKGLKFEDFTLLELTEETLKLIKQKDKKISAFLSTTDEIALLQAKELSDSTESPLLGVPIMIKDNILVKDFKATAGSKMLQHFYATYDATVIKKIKKAGGIIVGKGNMDEFAMGGSTENSAFFPTKNPVDLTKVPGGSSGGPAAAVSAGMVPVSLGSDTGGSIRQPASYCGVVGFKPSYGRVSRYGLISMASSLDQIGPFSRSVEDSRIVFDTIKGKDEKDATTVEVDSKYPKIDNFKVGIPKEYFVDGVDVEVKEEIERAIEKIKKAGVEVVETSLPHTEYALSCYQIIMACEASSNLARYDGIRYGFSFSGKKEKTTKDSYLKNRSYFGDEVKRRIILGTFSLSSGYYDQYYKKAQKVTELIKKDFEKVFNEVDVLLTPTSPILPFGFNEKIDNPLSMYLADTFTTPANLAGLPAISIPCKSKGLPIGLQLMGKKYQDEKLLTISQKIEEII